MTQGFLFTADDVQADATTDFAERMRHAADASEGRAIIREHEAAINAEERRLGFPPTVDKQGSGFCSRGFSTLKPKELAALSRRSQRCAELVRQGKEMRAPWETILAAHLSELRRKLVPNASEDGDEEAEACEDADLDAHPDCPLGEPRGAFNHCTLDGQPARIIGRSAPYATIEPVDPDAEPIDCPWDVVAQVLDERDGAFVSADAE
jgi:hypothetical protein